MKYSWKAIRDEICKIIKQISDAYGGDDPEWLRGYCHDLLVTHTENLDVLLAAAQGLLDQTKGPVLILNKDDFPRMEKERCQDGVKPTVRDSRHCMAMNAFQTAIEASQRNNRGNPLPG